MKTEEMKEVLGTEDEEAAPINSAASDVPEGSILSAIKAKRAEIDEDRRVRLPIPGYDGMLVAEFKMLPYEAIAKLAKKTTKSSNSSEDLNAMTDVIVQSCVEVFVRPEQGADLISLNTAAPEFGDEPVRFDPRLGKAAGVSGDTARLICQNVFNNDLALATFNGELITWMQGGDDSEGF